MQHEAPVKSIVQVDIKFYVLTCVCVNVVFILCPADIEADLADLPSVLRVETDSLTGNFRFRFTVSDKCVVILFQHFLCRSIII